MSRRRRDRAHGHNAELQAQQRFIDVLRHLQLASAGVMLVGLTVATCVCAGEFRLPWLVAAGGIMFAAGVVFYFAARPVARWWCARE